MKGAGAEDAPVEEEDGEFAGELRPYGEKEGGEHGLFVVGGVVSWIVDRGEGECGEGSYLTVLNHPRGGNVQVHV